MEQSVNTITLRGELDALPVFSHENHGKKFYRFTLNVPRLSGTVDQLNVIAQEHLMHQIDPSGGDMLTVCGQIRSHNVRTDDARRLLIFVFASSIVAESGPAINEVMLEGALCRAPIYRRTPLGREICDIMLAVPRAFHRADYLPCILWGANAQKAAGCQISQHIRLEGRLQSRNYTKQTAQGPQQRIAYEISTTQAQLAED